MLNLLHKDAASVSQETLRIARVALDRIADNPFQYRQGYHEAGLRELATNIHSLAWQIPATSGLQQPGLGRLARRNDAGALIPIPEDYDKPGAVSRLLADPAVVVQIAYGHRRVRAFHILAHGPQQFFPDTRGDWPQPDPAEYGTFPLQIAWLDDQAMAEFALTENSQREDVSAIEEAALLQRMITELGISLEEVGRKFGWSRPTVSNKLRLLRLPERVQKHVIAGDISEKHARTLLRVEAAPAILASLADKCRAEMWPVRKLDEQITDSIRRLKAVPDQRAEVPGHYGSTTVTPPWDLAWQPTGKDIRGACAGCPARIVFGNEPAPRCTDDACYNAKASAWPAEDFARQRQAARPILDEKHGGTTLLSVLTDAGPRRVKILDQPVKETWKVKDTLHIFNPNVLEEACLIDAGICGPHCKCFAACFVEPDRYYGSTAYRSARWRPAPDVAPDICYCCTDPACVAEQIKGAKSEANQRREQEQAQRDAANAADPEWVKRREEQARQDAARTQQERERNAQAQRLADSAVAAAGGIDALWSNKGFLVDLVRLSSGSHYPPERKELDAKTTDELRSMIIKRVFIGQYSYGGNPGPDLTAVQTLANRIAPPQPQPAPGDSQRTGWEAGWDIVDECAYQTVMGAWDGDSWSHLVALAANPGQQQDAPTARTLLRLIEACPDKTVRGQLWQQHNTLKAAA